MGSDIGLTRFRRLTLLATAAAALSGCAMDAVVKPATAEFTPKATAAIEQAAANYDAAIADVNELSARFLARNLECGLNDVIVKRTDAVMNHLRQRQAAGETVPIAEGNPVCLSEAEKVFLHKTGGPDGKAEALVILSRSEFAPQFAMIGAVLEYLKVLAEAADAPDVTVGDDIKEIAASIRTMVETTGKIQTAAGKGSGISNAVSADGKITAFIDHAAELATQIETIVDQNRDMQTLRATLGGPAGREIEESLETLASDADNWSCIRFVAQRATRSAEALALTPRLPKMDFEERLPPLREFVDYRARERGGTCGSPAAQTSAGLFRSAPGEMLRAVAKSHWKLTLLLNRDNWTSEQRRIEIAATLNRLAGTLKGIASIALMFV